MSNYNPFDEISIRLDRIEKLLDHLNFGKLDHKPEDELLTIDQASAYLKKPKKTLYKYTSNRSIPFIKSGRSLLFRKNDLDRWLEKQSSNSYE